MLTRRFTKHDETRTISYPDNNDWRCRELIVCGQSTACESAKAAKLAARNVISDWLADGWIEDAAPRKSAFRTAMPVEYDELEQMRRVESIAADVPEHPDWQEVFRRLGEDGVKNVTVRRRLLAAVQRAHRDRSDERERMRRVEAIAAEIRSRGEDGKTRKAADEAAMAKALAERPIAQSTGGQRRIDFSEE